MKNCPKCGDELSDNVAFCGKCGSAVTVQTMPSQEIFIEKKTSILSVIALILSILGFLTGFLRIGLVLDAIAIILVVISFARSKKKPSKQGVSIAATVIAVLSIILCMLAFGGFGGYLFKTTPSKEEMLETAISLNFRGISIEEYSNRAAFVNKYDETTCIISGIVDDITGSGSVVIKWSTGNTHRFTTDEIEQMGGHAFFAAFNDLYVDFADEAEPLNLKKRETITVVGIFDADGGRINNAYLVE